MNIIFCLLFALSAFAQESLDTIFSQKGGMTDAEAKAAKEFVHEGHKQETLKKNCEDPNNKAAKNCSENVDEVGSVLGGSFGQALENNIGKLYGVLMGAGFLTGSGGPKVNVISKKDVADKKLENNVKGQKKESQEKGDYCVFAAMGYELISMHMQQSMQNKIEKEVADIQDLQMRSLVALKKNHEVRQKTASYQRAIYGATSLCYIARASGVVSANKLVLDWKTVAKMSASTALTGLYWAKVQKHKRAAAAVQRVIDSLPKDGSCNPWTDTKCFCASPSSKTLYPAEYQEVCVVNKGNPETPKVAMGCGVMVDGKMNFDKQCECKKTNTCFKAKVQALNPKFKFGTNFMNSSNKGFELLSSGNFDSAQFDEYAQHSGVYAAKAREVVVPTKMPEVKLTEAEKKVADVLKEAMPESMAAIASKAPTTLPPGGLTTDGTSAALAKLSPELKEKIAATEPVQYKRGGSGFGAVAESEPTFQMPTLGETPKEESGTEILSFAEKAVSQADVTKTQDTPIFDIISNRYKRSGWTKLQAEEKK